MGPRTENDLRPKVSRQKRGTENREVSRERSVLDGWYGWRRSEKVRWRGDVIETLKAQASNFVLDPRLNWKPVECSKQ